MVKTMQRASDRLLRYVVPQVTAKAGPTCCTNYGSCWWGSTCYCSGVRRYRRYYCCKSDGSCPYYCRYAGSSCA
jgi:hypothetical protein